MTDHPDAARSGLKWWVALVGGTLAACMLGFAQKLPCWLGGWNMAAFPYRHACYTDIYPLYFTKGLAEGKIPYLDSLVEYPVLIGAAMQALASLVSPVTDPVARGRAFFDANVVLLTVAAAVTVVAVAALAGRRRNDAYFVAAAPGLILTAFINWDLLVVALAAVGLLAWARRRPAWAGVLLGLAVATKFYPLLFFGPMFLLCLRAGRLVPFAKALGAAVGVWLAVNLPVAIVAPHGWSEFYRFSQKRGIGWGSIWWLLDSYGVPFFAGATVDRINATGMWGLVALCAGIAVLALAAPRRPRLPQLLFLVVAAFMITNKVWSPQYVLWLLPLMVLARPRWGGYLLWQAASVVYFFAIWAYLLRITTAAPAGIGQNLYSAAIAAHILAVAVLCALVVHDVLRPQADIVRREGVDDPAGGVLDGVADWFALRPGALRLVGTSGRRREPEIH